MHDMLSTFHRFRFHILAFLILVLIHGMIPTKAQGEDLVSAFATIKDTEAPGLIRNIPKLKPSEWAKLPGAEFKVDATKQKTETGITVEPDDVYIVIPHPTDQWTQGPEAKYTKSTWKDSELPLQWFIGDEAKAAYEGTNVIVKGDGPLTIGHGDTNAGDNWGSIRVKVVKVLKPVAKKPKK